MKAHFVISMKTEQKPVVPPWMQKKESEGTSSV